MDIAKFRTKKWSRKTERIRLFLVPPATMSVDAVTAKSPELIVDRIVKSDRDYEDSIKAIDAAVAQTPLPLGGEWAIEIV